MELQVGKKFVADWEGKEQVIKWNAVYYSPQSTVENLLNEEWISWLLAVRFTRSTLQIQMKKEREN